MLTQVGWRVTTMRGRADGIDQGDARKFVEPGLDGLDSNANIVGEPRHLRRLDPDQVPRSYAASWASARRYPAIWLTPVMIDLYVAAPSVSTRHPRC